MHQGPRSNFEIAGTPLVTQYWGGGDTRHFFLLNLYNFKNIEGGHVPPLPPYSAVPVHAVNTSIAEKVLAKVSDWDCSTN